MKPLYRGGLIRVGVGVKQTPLINVFVQPFLLSERGGRMKRGGGMVST